MTPDHTGGARAPTAAPVHPISGHPPGVVLHATLESTAWWYDREGRAWPIVSMSDEHLAACVAMLEARAERFVAAERHLRSVERRGGWEVTTIPDPHAFPTSVAWLRSTPLLRAFRGEMARRGSTTPRRRR